VGEDFMDATTIIFWSAAGSAIGGLCGVIIFFLVRLLVEWMRSKPSDIHTYLCGNDLNQGQPNEADGELKHHHGSRISHRAEYQALDASNPLWEWTRTPAGQGAGNSVIYGPYSTDFAEPGLYSATFIIRGIGFAKPAEIINDLILLEIDVLKTIPSQLTPGPGVQHKISRQFIRVSELAEGGWRKFELRFCSDGQGLWEYRVFAYDGLDNKPDNIGTFGSQVRILFDKVIICKINKLSLPWV
jgi:hypothetical protein